MRKQKKILGIKRETFFVWLVIIGIILLFYLFLKIGFGSIGGKECPNEIQGNINASLKIKYFESPYCLYCWLEEPILKSLLKTRGHLFHLERYDIRYCYEENRKYGISGTPSFVFGLKDDPKEYTHYGFIEKEDLEKVICDATGGC